VLNPWIIAVVRGAARWPAAVIVVTLLATFAAIAYTIANFAINTDSSALLSPELPWRQREARLEKVFPGRSDVTVVVIDAVTPELAERAAAQLAERLAAKPALFKSVRRPDGGPFFERNSFLYLETEELRQTLEQLVAAQPLLGTIALDPSARGLFEALSLALEGVRRGEAAPEAMTPVLTALAATVEAVLAGRFTAFSLQSLLLGPDAAGARALRRFVLVQPVLDYTALMPGAVADDAIRTEARTLGFDAAHGVRVRLTGDIPLADEELQTLADDADLNATMTALSLIVLLWLAVRSSRIVAAILLTLAAGLVLTAATGLVAFGAFNMISMAFAVLFVGLGVDFGIQFAASYRAHLDRETAATVALTRAARQIGRPLALAAASTALGFLAFLPTEYRGLSELGAIAGTGMLIAFALTVTLLPALLRVIGGAVTARRMSYAGFGRADAFLQRHRRKLLAIIAIVTVAAAATAPRARFDFNPLHLRSPETESVSTLLELMQNVDTNPNTISVLTRSLADAQALAQKLDALPEVARTLTLASFVPENQQEKLALIADAALLLDPTLNPGSTVPPPDDATLAAAMRRTAQDLEVLARSGPSADVAGRLQRGLLALANGPAAKRAEFEKAAVPPLNVTLHQIRAALTAAPVTVSTIAPALAQDWVGTDGSFRVEAHPRGNVDDTENLGHFVDAVATVAPDATGPAVSIREASRTIIRAFFVAGFWAWLAITCLLAFVLRRLRDVVVTLAPLVLAGLATLALCGLLNIPLNFENIIALPLLLGVGVAFDIYFVMAWRAGAAGLLQSTIARSVIFSALTTCVAFGSLWLSHHPGTASMGKLLIISLLCTIVTTLLVLPVLLGPPRPRHLA
jgi:hopanoid biosynthesis associated RND transporter like protein HpnN